MCLAVNFTITIFTIKPAMGFFFMYKELIRN